MMYYFDSPFVYVHEINKDLVDEVKKTTMEMIDSHVFNNLCYTSEFNGGSITNYFTNQKNKTFDFNDSWKNAVVWDAFDEMVKQLHTDRDLQIFPQKASINLIWFNRYNKGSYAAPHSHFQSDISGIYVVDNKDETISTYFKQEVGVRNWLHSTLFYNPLMKEGTVTLFPSYLTHWIRPVEEERTIVAFDITVSV